MYVIDKFVGEYFFLSNFYTARFVDDHGIIWKTSEHFFQAMKIGDASSEEFWKINKCKSPGEAKKLGRICEIRRDWDNVKIEFMTMAITYKFDQNSRIKNLLMETNNAVLIEGNTWHDNYWGNCTCAKCSNKIGKNMLGTILMSYRKMCDNREYVEI